MDLSVDTSTFFTTLAAQFLISNIQGPIRSRVAIGQRRWLLDALAIEKVPLVLPKVFENISIHVLTILAWVRDRLSLLFFTSRWPPDRANGQLKAPENIIFSSLEVLVTNNSLGYHVICWPLVVITIIRIVNTNSPVSRSLSQEHDMPDVLKLRLQMTRIDKAYLVRVLSTSCNDRWGAFNINL